MSDAGKTRRWMLSDDFHEETGILLPCPFCGGENIIGFQCFDCCARQSSEHLWNTRAESAQLIALRARLAEMDGQVKSLTDHLNIVLPNYDDAREQCKAWSEAHRNAMARVAELEAENAALIHDNAQLMDACVEAMNQPKDPT